MKNKLWLTIVALLSASSGLFAQQLNVRYVPSFDNVNHPQVAYWFFADNMMQEGEVAVQVDEKGNLLKLAATKLANVKKNGKEIITISREADVFIIVQNGKMQATIAADPGTVQLTWNK